METVEIHRPRVVRILLLLLMLQLTLLRYDSTTLLRFACCAGPSIRSECVCSTLSSVCRRLKPCRVSIAQGRCTGQALGARDVARCCGLWQHSAAALCMLLDHSTSSECMCSTQATSHSHHLTKEHVPQIYMRHTGPPPAPHSFIILYHPTHPAH
jgi:hypothetical protein